MSSKQEPGTLIAAHARAAGWLTLAVFGMLLAAGCGEAKDKPASQAAAKVNADEITVHQINAELQRATRGNIPQGANTDAANKRILEGLIDQTLIVQQAKESKLDRDPQVMQQLESARRQILAQAYIDRQAAASPPTQDEIKDFYAKHPDLFEKRRVYAFREFLFERAMFSDDLRNQLNSAKTPADIQNALNVARIRFRETNNTRPAEALPIEALPRIARLAKGDSLAFTNQNLTNVWMLLDYAEQPVTLERATPLIQQYLVNQKKREIAQAKVKELRAKGKIEYVGNFAKIEADAKAEADRPGARPFIEEKKDDALDKGVQGLR
jgi:EpsD family peptidyl-prolyl cis-trans isomerase